MSNPASTPKGRLIGLINAVNTRQWGVDDLEFGAPTAQGGARNTSITATAAEGLPYTGQRTLTYNRVNFSALPGATSRVFDVSQANVVTHQDLAPLVAERFSILLTREDLANAVLPPPNEDGEIVVTLQAAPTSLIWLGSLEVTLTGVIIPLADVILNTELNGFVLGDLGT